MPTCPNGHQSVAEDWCEVCGHRMAGDQVADRRARTGLNGRGFDEPLGHARSPLATLPVGG